MLCYILDYCIGVECCVDIFVLGFGFYVFVFLDLDKLEFWIGLEIVKEIIKFNDYVWGEVKIIVVVDGFIKLR